MSPTPPRTDPRSRRSPKQCGSNSQTGPSVEELKEEEMYDADVEVVGPDEYEDADSDDVLNQSRKSSQSSAESDWQRDVLHGLNKLDCDSGSSGSSRPSSSGMKRKREEDFTFFRNKHLRARSPTPKVEIEEVASDESTAMRRTAQSLQPRRRSIRKPHTRLRNFSGTNDRESKSARRLSNHMAPLPHNVDLAHDNVYMDLD